MMEVRFMKVRKAVIPAAGFGTRFLPATKAVPKEMLPIVDKPAIQYVVEEAVAAGIEDILIITSRDKSAIENHFDISYELEDVLGKRGRMELLGNIKEIRDKVNIHYIRQKETKGLGHAIYCAKAFVGNEPFAIFLPDDLVDSEKPCIKQLIEVYERYNKSVVALRVVPDEDIPKYGIISGEELEAGVYKLSDMVEKPAIEDAASNVAIISRHVLTPGIFEALENTPPGKGNEIQLTDGLKNLLDSEDVYGYCFEGNRYDVGQKIGFLKATVEFALKHEELKDEFRRYLQDLMR